MKATTTWILIANGRDARIVTHKGMGNGLRNRPGSTWHAPDPLLHADRPGIGRAIAGPNVAAVGQSDPQRQAEQRLAREIGDALCAAALQKKFDRLLLIAGPNTLGVLRKELPEPVQALVVGTLDKDLSSKTLKEIEKYLGDMIAP